MCNTDDVDREIGHSITVNVTLNSHAAETGNHIVQLPGYACEICSANETESVVGPASNSIDSRQIDHIMKIEIFDAVSRRYQ